MNDRLLELIDKLYKEFGSDGLNFSLTLNYERVCSDYNPDKFDAESLIKIKSLIDAVMVESFNFTIIEESGKNNSTLEYSPYWYDLKYIFYGKNIIHCEFSFYSSIISLMQLPVKYKDEKSLPEPEATDENIKNLKYLAFTYKKASLEISNILKKIK